MLGILENLRILRILELLGPLFFSSILYSNFVHYTEIYTYLSKFHGVHDPTQMDGNHNEKVKNSDENPG